MTSSTHPRNWILYSVFLSTTNLNQDGNNNTLSLLVYLPVYKSGWIIRGVGSDLIRRGMISSITIMMRSDGNQSGKYRDVVLTLGIHLYTLQTDIESRHVATRGDSILKQLSGREGEFRIYSTRLHGGAKIKLPVQVWWSLIFVETYLYTSLEKTIWTRDGTREENA